MRHSASMSEYDFFCSFVSQEGDGSYMTMCIPCENASQEARDRYDYEWCHAMKPIEIYRRSHGKSQGVPFTNMA